MAGRGSFANAGRSDCGTWRGRKWGGQHGGFMALAEAAVAPAPHFALGGRTTAVRAGAQAVDIDPARVGRPDRRFTEGAGGLAGGGIVQLDGEIAHAETGSPQGPEQLVPVVTQGLEPLGMAGTNRQSPGTQAQGPAVGGQLGTGDLGPGLPKGSQVAGRAPLALQLGQATGQGAGGGRRGWHQQGDRTLAPTLVTGGDRHGPRLRGPTGWVRGWGSALVRGPRGWLTSDPAPTTSSWVSLLALAVWCAPTPTRC